MLLRYLENMVIIDFLAFYLCKKTLILGNAFFGTPGTSRYSFLFVNSMPSTPSPTLTCDNKIKLKIYFIMQKLKHNNPISQCGRGVCWYLVLIILFFPYNFPLLHPAPPIPNCPNPKSTITQNQLYCFCKNDNANHPTHPPP